MTPATGLCTLTLCSGLRSSIVGSLVIVPNLSQRVWPAQLPSDRKRRLEQEREVPPASDEEVDRTRAALRCVDPQLAKRILESRGEDKKGEADDLAAYAFHLPENPFETVGRPGYEAEERELAALVERLEDETSREHLAKF